MVPSLALLTTLFAISNGQPTGLPLKEECCDTKTVGGVTYTLAGRMDTRAYDCLNPCIYQKEGEGGAKFCFAMGDMKVECNDEEMEVSERPPMGGSERPPMGGSEEPPMGGSEEPPMGGSEKPPMKGSEKPPMEGTKNPIQGGGEATPGPGNPGGGSSSCSYPEKHTMNVYPGPAAECGYELIFSGLDQATKDLILDKHNQLRQKVASGGESGQPGATNMRKLTWNDELETVAQRWAGQCTFGHDQMRNLCDGTVVGQNAYFGSASLDDPEDTVNKAITKAAQAWYNEVSAPGFSPADINPYKFGDGTGHYTQVVWAETAQLGCGMVYYEGDDSWFNQLVICNYAVSGNLQGGQMYETGTGCGNCPAGTSCDATYDALCAPA